MIVKELEISNQLNELIDSAGKNHRSRNGHTLHHSEGFTNLTENLSTVAINHKNGMFVRLSK